MAAAQPVFAGHYQPHVPGDLGFYDLRLAEPWRQQVELARAYGVSAFCLVVHARSSAMAIERMLASTDNSFGFCLCLGNGHAPDPSQGVDALVDLRTLPGARRALSHGRYLRVGSRPVVVVERPDRLADPIESMRLWRDWCRQEGIGEIDLLFVEFQGAQAPEAYGCDAMIEFPPAHCTYFGPGSLRIIGYEGALIDASAAIERRDCEPRRNQSVLPDGMSRLG